MSDQYEYSDGAHAGIRPRDAMVRAIGGDEAPPEDLKTPGAMEAYLLAEDVEYTEENGYNESARRTARFILTMLRAHPELQAMPVETKYDFTWDEKVEEHTASVVQPGWDELFKAADPEGYDRATDGISGFQWGWACNAARYVLGLGPAKNPALVTVNMEAPE